MFSLSGFVFGSMPMVSCPLSISGTYAGSPQGRPPYGTLSPMPGMAGLSRSRLRQKCSKLEIRP